MVHARKSSEEHFTETQLIIIEIESQNYIDALQIDVNKVRLLTRQRKSNQIEQTILSHSKLHQKYINAEVY